MKREDCTFFPSRAAFREWLIANHEHASELLLGVYKKHTSLPSVTYVEAVEEALCFGWIDGVRRTVDDTSFCQRFTPRRPGSIWSAVNIARVEALIEAGLMQEAGLREFEARVSAGSSSTPDGASAMLSESYLVRFQASEAAWRFFLAQAPWYQHATAYWVMAAKREETRDRRFDTLLADSAAGKRVKQFAG